MLKNRDLHAHRPTHWLAIVAGAVLGCTLFASPISAATAAKPVPPTPQQREKLTISPETIMEPWTGDLDGMIQRHRS